MEQAAAAAITDTLQQLGTAGFLLLIAGGVAIWWLRASKDLREEKEGVITRLIQQVKDLKGELSEAHAQRDKYREAYLALKYPGSRVDPFDEEEAHSE